VGERDPARVRTAALTRFFGVAAAFLGLLVLLDMMGPPETYSCSGEPPPEAAEARSDYLPGALVLIVVFAVAFAWIAWRWRPARAPGGCANRARGGRIDALDRSLRRGDDR
jgi:hypothetical protein